MVVRRGFKRVDRMLASGSAGVPAFTLQAVAGKADINGGDGGAPKGSCAKDRTLSLPLVVILGEESVLLKDGARLLDRLSSFSDTRRWRGPVLPDSEVRRDILAQPGKQDVVHH